MNVHKTLKTKKLPGGRYIYLAQYETNHPGTMPKEMWKDFSPNFDRSYEAVIGLDSKGRGWGKYDINTHPKLSWYLEIPYFEKLHSLLNDERDFHALNHLLNKLKVNDMNHKSVTSGVEGILEAITKTKVK